MQDKSHQLEHQNVMVLEHDATTKPYHRFYYSVKWTSAYMCDYFHVVSVALVSSDWSVIGLDWLQYSVIVRYLDFDAPHFSLWIT